MDFSSVKGYIDFAGWWHRRFEEMQEPSECKKLLVSRRCFLLFGSTAHSLWVNDCGPLVTGNRHLVLWLLPMQWVQLVFSLFWLVAFVCLVLLNMINWTSSLLFCCWHRMHPLSTNILFFYTIPTFCATFLYFEQVSILFCNFLFFFTSAKCVNNFSFKKKNVIKETLTLICVFV